MALQKQTGWLGASRAGTIMLMASLLGTCELARASSRGLQQFGCSGIDVTAAPYSADATGRQDSAPALNAAIANAAGQTVCVPPGTYMVTEDVNINNDGVTVNAPSGATLMFRNSVQWFVRGSSNTIQNIYIDCQGTPFSGFVILGSNNHFTGSSASNNGQVGIAQNHCSGNTISGNTLTSNMDEGITADNQSNGAQITGNTVIGNGISGGVGGIGVDHSSGVLVGNNVVQNTMNGLPGIRTQNNLGETDGLFVLGNHFSNNAGVGVQLFCNNGCAVGATVAGNTFVGNAATGNQCNGQVQDDNPYQNLVIC